MKEWIAEVCYSQCSFSTNKKLSSQTNSFVWEESFYLQKETITMVLCRFAVLHYHPNPTFGKLNDLKELLITLFAGNKSIIGFK
ncbi:MAG: hypothetical protein ACK481_06325 [Candidatus Melainabacteria bacterium]